MTPLNIVVVNFTRMGDLVQSGPFLRSLKRDRACRLTVIVFELFRDVAERLPMVDSVMGFDVDHFVPRLDRHRGDFAAAYRQMTEFLRNSRLERIDELYNLSHTPQSASLCALMNPAQLYGMGRRSDGQLMVRGEWFNYLLGIMQDRTYNPFNLVEIYNRFNPCDDVSHKLELTVTDEDHLKAGELLRAAGLQMREPFVVLQPGASCASRMWPRERFAELAVRFASREIRTVIAGLSAEKDLAENVASLSRGSAVSIAGQTDIGALAAILKSSLKLISNDTGTIHIAAAVGTPTLGIYLGPAAAKDTAPYGDGHIVIEPDLSCSPCAYKSECNTSLCHHTIGVDQVFDLAMSEGYEQKIIAARCRGSRILRTEVSASGRLNLQPLNNPATGLNPAYLSFYAWFWDILLEDKDHKDQFENYAARWNNPVPAEWQSAVSRLSMIGRQAFESVRRLGSDAAGGGSEACISDSLRKQLEWQNDLRDFMTEYPELSSFPRYLLVRLSTARTTELKTYIEDLSQTLRYFRRGLVLLTGADDFQTKGISTDAAFA